MARQRRLDGYLRCFEVSDLADHNDVGVLSYDMTQRAGEMQADLRLDLDLIYPLELVLDRVLYSDYLPVRRIYLVERAVEGSCFPAACRTGNKDYAVGFCDD